MKKILMGLLAVSALSYTAPIQVTNPAQTDSSIFDPTKSQTGSITVNATITSNVEIVKYIAFANTTDSIDGASDSLTLTDFIIKAEAGAVPSDAGFSGTNPNLYVKRVVGGALQPLEDKDRLSVAVFRPAANDYWEFIKENTIVVENGNAWSQPLALLPTDKFDELATATGLTRTGKYWLKDSNNNGIAVKGFGMGMATKGILTFATGGDTTTNGSNITAISDADTISKWNEFFAQGVAFDTHVRIIVR